MPRPELDGAAQRAVTVNQAFRDGKSVPSRDIYAVVWDVRELVNHIRELEGRIDGMRAVSNDYKHQRDAARAELAQRTPSTELADYHPETGHLHTCTALITNATDLVARCVCAARLYCVAQDAEIAQRGEVVGWEREAERLKRRNDELEEMVVRPLGELVGYVVIYEPGPSYGKHIEHPAVMSREDADRLVAHRQPSVFYDQERYYRAEVRALAGEGDRGE